jgi:MFS family permease
MVSFASWCLYPESDDSSRRDPAKISRFRTPYHSTPNKNGETVAYNIHSLKTTHRSTLLSYISSAGTFASFGYRNYRLWFVGQLFSRVGSWVQSIAQGYLLYTLTGSAAYLGYVTFISGLPSWLLMLYGGLIADRFPRRTLLAITQAVKMLLAFILGGLVVLKWVQPWHILVLALLLGVANALDTPARKSIVVDLVEREDLTNAISLSDTMFYVGAIIGPAIGALVYLLTGPGWCFFLNGCTFVVVIIILLMMRIPFHPPVPSTGSALSAMAEGLRYVLSNRLVLTLTGGELLLNMIGYGPTILLPAWAVTVLHGGVGTNGQLLSAYGVGGILGGLLIAVLASRRNRGRVWTVGSALMPLAMFAFALAHSLLVSLLCLVLAGFAYVTLETNNSTIVQSLVPDELRGRVIALLALMYTGGLPLGALAVGLLADRFGEPFTFAACAIGLLIFAALIWFLRPEVRRID